MSINTVGILRRDLDTYLVTAYTEGAQLMKQRHQIALEGSSSLMSISNEGLLSWIKEKLVAIGRKFVVIVNKLIARFSKNREQIEANIREYQKNPEASVKLPASPKAISVTIACTAAIAVAIVAIIKLRKSENSKEKIKKIWTQVREKINSIKAKFKKEKAEAKGDTTVSAKEAENLSKKAAEANKKAEDAVRGAAKNMTSDTTGKSPEDVAGAGEAARATADLAEEAGKMGGHTATKAEISKAAADKRNDEKGFQNAKEDLQKRIEAFGGSEFGKKLRSKVAAAKDIDDLEEIDNELKSAKKEISSGREKFSKAAQMKEQVTKTFQKAIENIKDTDDYHEAPEDVKREILGNQKRGYEAITEDHVQFIREFKDNYQNVTDADLSDLRKEMGETAQNWLGKAKKALDDSIDQEEKELREDRKDVKHYGEQAIARIEKAFSEVKKRRKQLGEKETPELAKTYQHVKEYVRDAKINIPGQVKQALKVDEHHFYVTTSTHLTRGQNADHICEKYMKDSENLV